MAKVWTLCISAAEWAEEAFALCVRIARPSAAPGTHRNFSSPIQTSNSDSALEHREPADWPGTIVRRINLGEKVIVENVPLEKIADLCLRHNYRWRLDSISPKSSAHPRLIVELAPAIAHNGQAQTK